jgi:glutamate racemase
MRIGVFDSGVGGLTVIPSIYDSFPTAEVVFFGDTAFFPFNNQNKNTIEDRVNKSFNLFANFECDTVFIACNTAFSICEKKFSALNMHFKIYDVVTKTISYIKKSIKEGSKCLLLATEHTVRSQIYDKKIKELNHNIEIISLATPTLAALAESYINDTTISLSELFNYLTPINFLDYEAIILACTHYVVFANKIREFIGPDIKIINSSGISENFEKDIFLIEKKPTILCSKYNINFELAAKNLFNQQTQIINLDSFLK